MENIQKEVVVYSDVEIVELAMLEQFAKHHLGGDVDTTKAAIDSIRKGKEQGSHKS